MERNPTNHLRARGNLSYIQFVHLVKKIWERAHNIDGVPTVPILPEGSELPAYYPCIYYSLDLRRAHPDEPKMKIREIVDDRGEVFVVSGQRFQNVVKFTAITESDPDLATDVMEIFEDFMMEYTPLFKELGASEFVYSRRYSDTQETRSGTGVVKRSVAYLLTTEKIAKKKYNTLDEISIEARTWLEDTELYPYFGARVSRADTSPRFYLQGPDATLGFIVTAPSSDPFITIQIPKSNFRSGDRLFLISYDAGDTMPNGMESGIYKVVAPVNNDVFTADKQYTVQMELKEEGYIYNLTGGGSGLVFYLDQTVPLNIVDQQVAP